jgi:hypothetical protein
MSAIEIGERDDSSPIHIDEIPGDVLGMVLAQGLEWIYLIHTYVHVAFVCLLVCFFGFFLTCERPGAKDSPSFLWYFDPVHNLLVRDGGI